MSRIQTPITGITTTYEYNEGECYSLVNLRPKNGALQPVSPRKVMQELSHRYDIIFVHRNNSYENWIGVRNEGSTSSVSWDIRKQHFEVIIPEIPGPVNSVQQIGNTLSLITPNNIYYLLYNNNYYTFLGEIPQVPPIRFGSLAHSQIERYFIDEYGSGTITPDSFIDATKGLVNKCIDVLVNGGVDNEGNQIEGETSFPSEVSRTGKVPEPMVYSQCSISVNSMELRSKFRPPTRNEVMRWSIFWSNSERPLTSSISISDSVQNIV